MAGFNLIPAVMFFCGLLGVFEQLGAFKASDILFRPLLRPLLGIPGKCGIAFISSFTGSDVAAVMTRELYEDGEITDDERTIFVAYQYAGSACINNTITGGAPLVAICPVALGPCIVIMFVCKLIGANIVRLILRAKRGKAAAPAKAKKPSIVDTFLKGCAKGFKVGIENITPAMILGYVLVYILKETGLMDILGTVMSPVMGLFGLPGEAFAVLISAFFAKASGCATAASMYEAGALTLGQASMMLPACILMGTLIGHYARIVLVTDTNKKWHPLLIAVCLLDAAISLVIMRIILAAMGVQ